MNTLSAIPKSVRYAIFCIGGLLLLAAGVMYYKATHILAGAVDLMDRPEISIVLTEQGFEPQHVRIRAGTTVVFTTTRDKQFWPASNPHPSHGLYPGFDPERPLATTESWSFTPDTPGVWGYHDHIRSYYTGILYVE